jgi:DamX protein
MKFNKLSLISLFILSLSAYSNPLLAVETGGRTATNTRAALSFDQIKTAAQSGDADAQYALGYMYYYGKSGAPKDPSEAKKWISKAASQKQPQAEKALALMNKQQNGQVSPNQGYANQATNDQKSSERQTPPVVNQSNQSNSRSNLADKTPSATKESELRQSIENENKMTLVDTRNQNATPPSKESRVASIQAASEQSTAAEQQQEAKETVKDKAKETIKPKSVSVSEKQSGNFTLQLLGSYHRDLVAKELKSKHLENKANIYQTTFNNKDWFVLLYGRYDSKVQANEAAKSLESKLDLKPWVKPTATIKTYKKLSD